MSLLSEPAKADTISSIDSDDNGQSWWQGASLVERCLNLAAEPILAPPQWQQQIADQRLQLWFKHTALNQGKRLQERLANSEISATQFRYLLGESEPALCERMDSKPAWRSELESIYLNSPAGAYQDIPLDFPYADEAAADVLTWLQPLIGRTLTQFIDDLAAIDTPLLPAAAAVVESLRPSLCEQLHRMCQKTFLLELQVSRMQERLPGDDPSDRYHAFVSELTCPQRCLQLFAEYPVLARQVLIRCRQWRESHIEFIQRLSNDHQQLSQQFNRGQPLGVVNRMIGSRGDRHYDGRTVMVIHFDSGLRLVYKPKSLAIDCAFQQLIEWLNQRGCQPALPVLNVIDCGDYGWCEYISHAECRSHDEVQRFYQRQGANIALLHALEATDFHYENIIAQGEMPYLIDLETLLQPLVKDPTAVGPGSRIIGATALRSGVMPTFSDSSANQVDLSGLGDSHGRPTKAARLVDIGLDTMRLSPLDSIMPAGSNQALFEGQPLDARDYSAAVLRGYSAMYRLLLIQRDALLADDGPLSAFRACRTRFIIRGTDVYVRLLLASFHPDYLRNGLLRDRLLDKLWLDYAFYPAVRQLIPGEQWAMARGDVPCFHTHADSRDLVDDRGVVHADFFPHSGYHHCRQRIASMSSQELAQQYRLLKDCLLGLHHQAVDQSLKPEVSADSPPSPSSLIATAERLGQHIALHATRHNGYIGWLQVGHQGAGIWGIDSTSNNLYEGLCGFALLFAALHRVTGRERYADDARLIWLTARQRIRDNPRAFINVGAYSGWGGVFYTARELGRAGLLDATDGDIQLWRQRLRSQLDDDREFDLISGSAGAIMGLLRWHEYSADTAALDLARDCARHLQQHAVAHGDGLSWPCASADGMALTGLGHGAAGIALALAHLHQHTGDHQHRAMAVAALNFENQWYSSELSNWIDRRKDSHGENDESAHLHAWCHGGPGIGLARMDLRQLLDEPFIHDDLEAAIRCTLAGPWGHNQSLCHGDLGNLELIQRAALELADDRCQQFNQQQLAWLTPMLRQQRQRGGQQVVAEHFGLMNGTAGMAYALLRQARPDQLPSLLTLQ
ncbi:MAG: type 2 lanthipeptide synthetase LanM family protein [Wenzhouxiangellaceae bacterium]